MKVDFALNDKRTEFLGIGPVKWVWLPHLGLWTISVLFPSECFSGEVPNCVSELCKGFKCKRNIIEVILGVVGPEVLFGIGGCSVGGVVGRIVRIITIAIVTTSASWHWSVGVFVTIEVIIIGDYLKARSVRRLLLW